MNRPGVAAGVLLGSLVVVTGPRAATQGTDEWRFVASGDSRNCGDVVMPAIAKTATANHAAFFWYLGDLRAISRTDDDMTQEPARVLRPMTREEYLDAAWPDAIEHQIRPFGAIPFILGIGNHDVLPPKTRDGFIAQFSAWLDQPMLREQRLKDDPDATAPATYAHWIQRGVAFFSLDNASIDQMDDTQLEWFERTIGRDAADAAITSIVAGMHKPLPFSLAGGHSMNESPTGVASGLRVVAALQRARNESHKRVYALASHQHFYMPDYMASEYWKAQGEPIPGWIVGTAGASRYVLPVPAPPGSKTNIYGSLVATVRPDGEIRFKFEQVHESDIPGAVVTRYGRDLVRWCTDFNTIAR